MIPSCALTIDLEDWFQGIEIAPEQWSCFESRIEYSTGKLLEVLNRFQSQATFFVSGFVAQKHPDLIKEIERAGHEIASHGFRHDFVYRLTPAEFRKDLKQSLRVLGRIARGKILGFRAPYFSITKASLWAFDEIKRCGFEYDSSIFPIRNYRYGIPGSPRLPYPINDSIWEFPVTTGGVYFRALPYWLIRRKLQKGGVFYLHPWEVDSGHPRIRLPARIALPHYYNLHKTEARLQRLLSEIKFSSISKLLEVIK